MLSALLVLVGGVPMLLGLLGMPGLTADPRWLYWMITFDVLNNFLPVWAALVASGLALALLRRRRSSTRFLFLSAVLLTMALTPIALEVARSPRMVDYAPGRDAGRAVRVLQLNALSANHDLNAALDMVLAADADLIMVQEPIRFRDLEPYLQMRYPFRTPCPKDRCRAVIYSASPPLRADYQTLRGDWYREKFTVGNGLLGVATMRFRGPDGEPFDAIATHFRWPYPPLPVLHQRDVFLRHIRAVDRSRAIVAGDFNLAPWTFEMRGLDADMGPMRRLTHALFTFPAPFTSPQMPLPFPILPIDHVYAGARWQPVAVSRGPLAGSDHYPVIVELVMAQERGG